MWICNECNECESFIWPTDDDRNDELNFITMDNHLRVEIELKSNEWMVISAFHSPPSHHAVNTKRNANQYPTRHLLYWPVQHPPTLLQRSIDCSPFRVPFTVHSWHVRLLPASLYNRNVVWNRCALSLTTTIYDATCWAVVRFSRLHFYRSNSLL